MTLATLTNLSEASDLEKQFNHEFSPDDNSELQRLRKRAGVGTEGGTIVQDEIDPEEIEKLFNEFGTRE